jgi:hypothetical protein
MSKMESKTLPICLARIDQELSAWNATSRNFICPLKMTKERQRIHSTVWDWMHCPAGYDIGFGIPENLLLLGSLLANR